MSHVARNERGWCDNGETSRDSWMSHAAHTNESRHTYESVTSHIRMSHVTHMNESRHTYEWVTSHIWMGHVERMNKSCCTYEWVMSHAGSADDATTARRHVTCDRQRREKYQFDWQDQICCASQSSEWRIDLLHTAMHCKHTATSCSILQHTVIHCKALQRTVTNCQIWFACSAARNLQSDMGWLRLVGSLNLRVSVAKEPYERDDILQKRPIILSIILTVATP